jgi:hypothetical protein
MYIMDLRRTVGYRSTLSRFLSGFAVTVAQLYRRVEEEFGDAGSKNVEEVVVDEDRGEAGGDGV